VHTPAHNIHVHTALSNTVGRFKTSQNHPALVQIYWEAIREDVVTGYTVQVEGPDSTQEIPITNKYSTSVEIPDLLPSAQYTFEISAVKGMDKINLTHPSQYIIMHICIQYLVLLVN
jgi:hypothetical protein